MSTNDPRNGPKGDFYQKKGNDEPLRVPPGDPDSSERNAKKLDQLYGHGSPTKEQIIIYVVLVIGLISVFIDPLIGGLIIGAAAGYYYAAEIIFRLRNIGQLFSSQEPTRYIVLTGLMIGLFIAAPGFFIGGIIAAAIRHLLFSDKEDTK